MCEKNIDRAAEYIKELFAGNSDGHDADHSMRVYNNALMILECVPCCDREAVLLAALLHDADDHKLFKTENNANARSFLADCGLPDGKVEKICEAINSVSFSRNRDRRPETLEGQIVQDADRLDALGAIGIARTFAFGGKNGRPLGESVQHFHDKLLLLSGMMNTQAARRIAEKRHEFLLEFLKELEEEHALP